VFCSSHFSYEAHACPKGRVGRDRRVAVCLKCSMALPLKDGQSEVDLLDQHVWSGACSPPEAAPARKPKCPVHACREKLSVLNSFDCKRCCQRVCMKHRFDDMHNCETVRRQRSSLVAAYSSGRSCGASMLSSQGAGALGAVPSRVAVR